MLQKEKSGCSFDGASAFIICIDISIVISLNLQNNAVEELV